MDGWFQSTRCFIVMFRFRGDGNTIRSRRASHTHLKGESECDVSTALIMMAIEGKAHLNSNL
jgi:hypothetical protein